MRKIQKCNSGEMLPPFYGVAYRDYARNEAVLYPLVINLFVLLWREFVYWLKNPKGE